MSGVVASSFTAYISHKLADCWWKRMGLGEIVRRGFGEGRGALCVNCTSVYQNVLAEGRETERGGGYLENQRSKFIIVMAFSDIHFPVVC